MSSMQTESNRSHQGCWASTPHRPFSRSRFLAGRPARLAGPALARRPPTPNRRGPARSTAGRAIASGSPRTRWWVLLQRPQVAPIDLALVAGRLGRVTSCASGRPTGTGPPRSCITCLGRRPQPLTGGRLARRLCPPAPVTSSVAPVPAGEINGGCRVRRCDPPGEAAATARKTKYPRPVYTLEWCTAGLA